MKSLMNEVMPGSPGGMLALVRSGASSSRSDLVRLTGMSASTVSTRVELLLAHGLLEEAGAGASRGGRRPRNLRIPAAAGVVAAADLGAHHGVLGIVDLGGELLASRQVAVRIDDGPAAVLPQVFEHLRAMVSALPNPDTPMRAIALGLPGPVEAGTGRVISPSRMPGWNGVRVPEVLAPLVDVPVLVENDANVMALGEHAALDPAVEDLIVVKAGTGIGCGVISAGRLHRGARGAAGDISHIRVAGGPDVACSCGRTGCLDAIASGAALVTSMRAQGIDVSGTDRVVELAGDADPVASKLLRAAGRATGEVLASVVNFFNPQALVIGGQLGRAQPFVASLQAALYELCLPMATEHLEVSVARTGVTGGVLGAGKLALDHLLDPARVNAQLIGSDAGR